MHWSAATTTLLAELIRQSRIGLLTDMDGTISPIVPHPDQAQITPQSRELLHALASRLALVAVISGRAVTDLRERVGLPSLIYVGNHGLEWWSDGSSQIAPDAEPFRPNLLAAYRSLQSIQIPGLIIEDKAATLSIHYRLTENPDQVERELRPQLEQVAAAHQLALFQGRRVFELRPPIHTNKGTALAQLVQQFQLDGVIYLGDDTTDADALRIARQLRRDGICFALGLGVQSEHMSADVLDNADLLAHNVQDVEAFLSWLLNALSASSS